MLKLEKTTKIIIKILKILNFVFGFEFRTEKSKKLRIKSAIIKTILCLYFSGWRIKRLLFDKSPLSEKIELFYIAMTLYSVIDMINLPLSYLHDILLNIEGKITFYKNIVNVINTLNIGEKLLKRFINMIMFLHIFIYISSIVTRMHRHIFGVTTDYIFILIDLLRILCEDTILMNLSTQLYAIKYFFNLINIELVNVFQNDTQISNITLKDSMAEYESIWLHSVQYKKPPKKQQNINKIEKIFSLMEAYQKIKENLEITGRALTISVKNIIFKNVHINKL